jgi:hypothetical protein
MHHALNSVFFALNVMQAIAIFADMKSNVDHQTILGFVNFGFAAVSATSAGMTVAARVFIGKLTVNPVLLRLRMASLSKICGVAGRAITFVGGVLSIINGVETIIEAFGPNRVDGVKIVVGGLSVASGVFLCLSALARSFSAAWLGPIGVVVGVVSLAISVADALGDTVKPAPQKFAQKLYASLESSMTRYGMTKLFGMQKALEELKEAIDDASADFYQLNILRKLKPAAGQTVEDLVKVVRDFGFPESMAKELVEAT